MVNSYLVSAAVFALALPVATLIDDQGKASAVLLAGVFLLYLASIILSAAGSLEYLARAIPFYHHDIGLILAGEGISPVSLGYLLSLTFLGLVAAVLIYGKRDFTF